MNRKEQLRQLLAQEAARIMIEGGVKDYLGAKRKAAERLRCQDMSALPSNLEIETAIDAHQRLFLGTRRDSTLRDQRQAALGAMDMLEDFNPRLVGSVLSGSATPHADVILHVFSDSAESVFLHLLDRRYDHQLVQRKMQVNGDQSFIAPGARFGFQDQMVEVVVFPRDGIRQAPASPVDGKPMRRATRAELLRLLEQPGTEG